METAQISTYPILSQGLLGKLLPERHLITRQQLDKAIERQCLHGGRLGTCLLETDSIDEEILSKTLNIQWQRPYFPASLLMDIPRHLLQLLSVKTILSNKFLPFKKNDLTLYVGVTDCRNDSLFTELETLTGLNLVPVLFSDMRLAVALNKYFSRPLPPRYEQLATDLKKRQPKPLAPQIHHDHPQTKHKNTLGIKDTGSKACVNATLSNKHRSQPLRPHPSTTTGPDEDFAVKLTTANSLSDIFAVLNTYLEDYAINSALIAVKNKIISGWCCSNQEENNAFSKFRSDLFRFPTLKKIAEERIIHYGQSPPELETREFNDIFNGRGKNRFFIAPVSIKKRTCALLCLELKKEIPEDPLYLLDNVCQKLELALQLLILKNKILAPPEETHE